MAERKRLSNPGGTPFFKPGHGKHGGRLKGVPNRVTRELKSAILEAAEKHGSDGKGRDGIVGYLFRLAKIEPKAFSALLGRILPLQISGDANNPVRMITSSMSPQEAAQLYAQTIQQLQAGTLQLEAVRREQEEADVFDTEAPGGTRH